MAWHGVPCTNSFVLFQVTITCGNLPYLVDKSRARIQGATRRGRGCLFWGRKTVKLACKMFTTTCTRFIIDRVTSFVPVMVVAFQGRADPLEAA